MVATTLNLSSIISEKEKLQNELENALNQIDQLKTLVAENTLQSLYTVQGADESHDSGEKTIDMNNVSNLIVGATAGINPSCFANQGRTHTEVPPGRKGGMRPLGAQNRSKSRGSLKVPGLDFSNLKQVRDFKDWYSYSKKLEDAIRLLREKIREVENSEDEQIGRAHV